MSKRARTIALDTLGSDHGEADIVKGALESLDEGPHKIVLVGREARLIRYLRHFGFTQSKRSRITIAHASDEISMNDKPRDAVRNTNSSIYVGAQLVKDGGAEAFISAGNTGVVMATAKLRWGGLAGIRRPAIATVIPSHISPCLLLDIGANVDCKPKHLFHFGVMGSVYAKSLFKRRSPRVGLLSIGEEEFKGNAQTFAAYKFFEASTLNFIGNVEGRDILNDRCDVVVCDGFVGNIILKFGESLAEHILTHLKGQLKSSLIASLASLALTPTFRKFKRQMDPDEFGGAPLLGLNHPCIICHGSTNSKAIRNAIKAAARFVEQKVNQHIIEEVEANQGPISSST